MSEYKQLNIDNFIKTLLKEKNKKYSNEEKILINAILNNRYFFEEIFNMENENLIEGLIKEYNKFKKILNVIITNEKYEYLNKLGQYKLPKIKENKELIKKYLKDNEFMFSYFKNFLKENNLINEKSILYNISYKLLNNKNTKQLFSNIRKKSYYIEENLAKVILQTLEKELKNIINQNIDDITKQEKENNNLNNKNIEKVINIIKKFEKPSIIEFTRTQTNILDNDKGIIQLQEKKLSKKKDELLKEIQNIMKKIGINTLEYDKSTDLELIKNQFELFKNLNIKIPNNLIFKYRKIGNYKGEGFYIPSVKILVVGVNTNGSSFLHEITHVLDFQKKLQENKNIQELIDYFSNKIDVNKIPGNKVNYYLSPEEILARLGELYFLFNRSNEIYKKLDNDKIISLIAPYEEYIKHKNIYFNFDKWTEEEKQYLKNVFEKIVLNNDLSLINKKEIDYKNLRKNRKLQIQKNETLKNINIANKLIYSLLDNINNIDINNLKYEINNKNSIYTYEIINYLLNIKNIVKIQNKEKFEFFKNFMIKNNILIEKDFINNNLPELNNDEKTVINNSLTKTFLNYEEQIAYKTPYNLKNYIQENKIHFILNNKNNLKKIQRDINIEKFTDNNAYILINKNKLINVLYEQMSFDESFDKNFIIKNLETIIEKTSIMNADELLDFKNKIKEILVELYMKKMKDSGVTKNMLRKGDYLLAFLYNIINSHVVNINKDLNLDNINKENVINYTKKYNLDNILTIFNLKNNEEMNLKYRYR